jgi:hypothetical protein
MYLTTLGQIKENSIAATITVRDPLISAARCYELPTMWATENTRSPFVERFRRV